MKVILKDEIVGVGKPGNVVTVSDGFARNFLFPQKKGIPATEENLKQIEKFQQNIKKKIELKIKEAESLSQKLSALHCIIEKKAGKDNKIFGSVTTQDIYQSLLQLGTRVEKRDILLDTPIKELGDFDVSIRLHAELKATIKVTVKALSS